MKQYNIQHHLDARIAFEKHFPNIDHNPNKFFELINEGNVKQLKSMQAWAIYDTMGNIWLQSYNTIVSVKWADTGTFERLGKWSVTTSKHQAFFRREF
jgi:hypothetical protein